MTNSLRGRSGCRHWRDTAQFWGAVTLILVVRLIRTPLLSFRGNGVFGTSASAESIRKHEAASQAAAGMGAPGGWAGSAR